jgi:hypothetical protein
MALGRPNSRLRRHPLRLVIGYLSGNPDMLVESTADGL